MEAEITPIVQIPVPTIALNYAYSPMEGLSTSFVGTEATNGLVPMASYDIGSGATKVMGAMVNTTNLSIEHVFFENAVPVGYRKDLLNTQDNNFSDLIQDMGLHALLTAKNNIEHAYANSEFKGYGEIQHFAVATAAFRVANNGELVASKFEQALDFPINIISQEEEGILAYHGALANTESTVSEPIVWDIGGGSMQLTHKDANDNYHILQGSIASETFYALLKDNLMPADSSSLYPMNADTVQAAIELAKQHLVFDQHTTEIIQSKIDNQSTVLAVGTVHNMIIKPLCELAGTSQDGIVTKHDLYHAITLLTDKTEDHIKTITNTFDDFVKNKMTNLILVYTLMEQMNIDKIEVVKSNNTQGLMLKNAKSLPMMSPIEEKPLFIF